MSDEIVPGAMRPSMPVRRRVVRLVRRRPGEMFGWFAFSAVLILALLVAVGGRDVRAVFGPALVAIAMAFLYLVVLTKRQGHLPMFEAATFFVLATMIYTVVPLLQFAMSGMQCINGGDYRLFVWNPTPQQFGGFAWRHVLLLTTFVLVYLVVRGKRLWPMRELAQPAPATLYVIVTLVLVLRVYFLAIRLYVGPTVSAYEGGSGNEFGQLPLVVQQVTNVLLMVLLTLKQCLVIVLLKHWQQRLWRNVLLIWLLAELAMTVVALESRAGTVVLLVTFLVGYHHIVKPISVAKAFLAGGALLLSFLIFGVVRDLGTHGIVADRRAAWGSPSEFIILYGNAYDIHMRKQERSLPPIPEFLNYSDFYRLVPSQILPFRKWEPSIWYKDEVMGLRDTGMGFVFGIVAQSVLGHDWIELFLRAIILALFYAAAHRTWRRYSGSFWATITYLFILTWAYYAFRLSSFEILYRLVYYLAPTVIIVTLLTKLLSVPVQLRRRMRMRAH